MICIKCNREAPDGPFCSLCGWNQAKNPKKRSFTRRGNHLGSAYKRGRTWTASVVVGWKTITDKNGNAKRTPKRRTKGGFSSKTEALLYVNTLLGSRPENERTTLYSLYQAYNEGPMCKLSKSKQDSYKIAAAKLDSIFYSDIKDLRIEDLQRVIDSKAPTYYPARDMKVLLSHLYKRAAAQELVKSNLAEYIVLPQLEETEQRPFNETELRALWKDYSEGNRFTGYILLMIYSGMMPGELLEAKKDMINWDNQTIIGCGKKTRKRKATPLVIADIIVPVLQDITSSNQSEKILAMSKDNFYQEYYKTIERCGCRKLPPYSCRHTTATALALGNIAPNIIKEVMRHTKITTTQRYIHVDATPMLDAVNTLK